MINQLTKKEHDFITKDHNETLKNQGVMYSKYMEDRFFRGDFPQEAECGYSISVLEGFFEDTIILDRAISAPPVSECYENILYPNMRFGKSGYQYRRNVVIPMVYQPCIGDIVTLPVHLMIKAAESDKRLNIASNWHMMVTGIEKSNTCTYEYTMNPRTKSELLPEKVKLHGVMLTVAPIEFPDEPFKFPALPMMHYILIVPTQQKENENDITRE